MRSRKIKRAAPAVQRMAKNAMVVKREPWGEAVRRGPNCDPASVEEGRGLPTWEADRISFVSSDAGAWGTTIFWKQVGHSICPPLVLESAVIC
jgi:hypothetical protein